MTNGPSRLPAQNSAPIVAKSWLSAVSVAVLPSPTQQGSQTQLQFVNSAGPESLRKSDTKRLIRAHAARSAHSKIRRARTAEYQQTKISEDERDDVSIPGPVALLGNGRVDPFGTYAVHCSAFEHALIDHYVHFLIPNHASHFSPMGSSTHTGRMYSHWVSYTITDSGMMNGLFLAACRSLANQTHRGIYAAQALRYKGACIRSVAKAIEGEGDRVSDSTVAKVLFLAYDEFHTGNLNGAKSHTKAIGDMVKMRGGVETLGLEGLLQQLVLWNDRTSTFYSGSVPNFMHTGSCKRLTAVDHLTPGFLRYFDMSMLSFYVGAILNDMCYFTKVVNSLPKGAAIPTELIKRINAKELDVRLLILSSDHRCPSARQSYTQIEECLALALMVYLRKVLHPPGSDVLGREYLLERLRDSLALLRSNHMWRHGADLMLWMAFMASYMVYEIPKSEPIIKNSGMSDAAFAEVESWLLGMLCDLFEALDIQSFHEMEMQLQNFTWIEKPCVTMAMELYTKVRFRYQILQ
ncbi:hypothetical protein V498_06076 [Pseudogymnoascus sp. VKM F-4517 (FW-2822)]|nr:hypothetical protein V498_06076 [Pseudogymnoascus sp. VKM F-4517 (FW-2822)]